MVQTLGSRFGEARELPHPTEWPNVTGAGYSVRDTRELVRDIGLLPRRTPNPSPQRNGILETLAKTFKRDYIVVNPTPGALMVLKQRGY